MLSIEACCFIEHFFGKNASTYVYMGTAVHVDVSLYGLIPLALSHADLEGFGASLWKIKIY